MTETPNSKWLFVSVVLPLLHLCLCFAVKFGFIESEGSWGWFLVFVVDLPLSLLFFPLLKVLDPLLVFGVLGTVWWYGLTRLGIYVARRMMESRRQSV